MTKFHMGANGPGRCDAQPGNCPLKDEDGNQVPHGSKEEMQKAYEEKLESEHGEVTTVNKSLAALGTISNGVPIDPDADGLYEVEPGKYYYMSSEDDSNLFDDDENGDSKFAAIAEAPEGFSAMNIGGGRAFVSQEGWSGVSNMLISEKAMDELVKNGFVNNDREKVVISVPTKIAPTELSLDDGSDYFGSKIPGEKTLEQLAWSEERWQAARDA